MTANKHTPGAVELLHRTAAEWLPVVGSNGLLICMLGHSVRMIDQKEIALANARLIAAAPDLLEALQGVVRVADRSTMEFFAAHAAIAKATGETP